MYSSSDQQKDAHGVTESTVNNSLLPFTLLHKILQTFSSPFSFFHCNAPYCPILEKMDKAEMMAWLLFFLWQELSFCNDNKTINCSE